MLRMLLDHGADINNRVGRSSDGWTPLHFSASYGSRKRVKRKCFCGAQNPIPETILVKPLQLALSFGHVEVFKALLQFSTPGSMDTGAALPYAVRRGIMTWPNVSLKLLKRTTLVIHLEQFMEHQLWKLYSAQRTKNALLRALLKYFDFDYDVHTQVAD